MKKNILSIVLSSLSTIIIGTIYWLTITKISPMIASEYQNENLFFQTANTRDIFYIIQPVLISLSSFAMWFFSFSSIRKIISKGFYHVLIFSLLYSSIVLSCLLLNYASLKISFCVFFGWFCQYFIQSLINGFIFLKFKISL